MSTSGRRVGPGARPQRLPLTSSALLLAGSFAGAAGTVACARGAEPPPTPAAAPVASVEPGVVLGRACVPTGVERCFDARDDNCNGLIDEGCGQPTGLVQFVIAWREAVADVDLLVTGPDGELADVGRATSIGLVKERDCPGRAGDCAGQNVENVFLDEGDVTRGRYQVRVRLEELGTSSPPVRVTFGARVGPKTYAAELELEAVEAERGLTFSL